MSTQPQPDLLPDVSEETLSRMERGVFDRIRSDRGRSRARRGRVWLGAGAAAALVVVAAIISPAVLGGIAGGAASDEAGYAVPAPGAGAPAGTEAGAMAPESITGTDSITGADSRAGTMPEGLVGGAAEGGRGDLSVADGSVERELIASGSLSLRVDDVEAAAAAVAEEAEARGGYVESMNVEARDVTGQGSGGGWVDPYAGGKDASMPVIREGAWVQVRVPADQLSEAVTELGMLGEVTASSVSRQDVTEQAVDLRARIASAEASVARLMELMAQSGSVADLIAAETALAERQATLESYQQQLELLEQQVALSSLVVELTPVRGEPVEANPAGFGDGIAAGWNGLVATLNGIVVALGFLLPWLAVIGVATLVVWAIVRLVRGRRAARADSARQDPDTDR